MEPGLECLLLFKLTVTFLLIFLFAARKQTKATNKIPSVFCVRTNTNKTTTAHVKHTHSLSYKNINKHHTLTC